MVGRTSFEQGYRDWLSEWPWPDKKVYVLTSTALPRIEGGFDVEAALGGPAALVRKLRGA